MRLGEMRRGSARLNKVGGDTTGLSRRYDGAGGKYDGAWGRYHRLNGFR